MKSIFSPAMPQDFHSGSCLSRCAWVASAGLLVQSHTPTCFALAYFTRVGIQLALQPASTRRYSQPIRAAKSAAAFCAARLWLLLLSDHHDHSERPALIQDVSAIFDGLARSVTRSLCVTVARSPMTIVRHGVVTVPGSVSCASGRVSLKCRLVASRVSRVAPYPPLMSDSVTSSQVSATWNRAGYP